MSLLGDGIIDAAGVHSIAESTTLRLAKSFVLLRELVSLSSHLEARSPDCNGKDFETQDRNNALRDELTLVLRDVLCMSDSLHELAKHQEKGGAS